VPLRSCLEGLGDLRRTRDATGRDRVDSLRFSNFLEVFQHELRLVAELSAYRGIVVVTSAGVVVIAAATEATSGRGAVWADRSGRSVRGWSSEATA